MKEILHDLVAFLFPDHAQLTAIPPLDGPLVPNDRLDEAEPVCQFTGEPDDILAGEDGILVTCGRQVLRVPTSGGAEPQTVCTLPDVAGPVQRTPDGVLLVGVAGVGLVRVRPGAEPETLLESVDGVPLHCLTDIALAPDGVVYLTDGTRAHRPEDWVRDLMEQNAAGRLIRFDPVGGSSEVLAHGLRYAAGVCLTPAGDALLVTEAWAHRVSQLSLGGAKRGELEPVHPNLGAYPGRLSGGDDDVWLSIFALRTHLVEFVLTQDNYRREMMRTIHPDWWIRPTLRTLGSGLEPLQEGQIKKLGKTKPWAPPRSYGLIVQLDRSGQMIDSLHSRAAGRYHGVTSSHRDDGDLLVMSRGARVLLRVALDRED